MWLNTTSFITVLLLLLLSLSPETSVRLVKSLNVALNDDVLGLMVFKSDIQDPYFKLSTWKEEDDSPCKWVGVTCDKYSGRVTEVYLNGFSLSGHISKGLLRLQFLQTLSLSRNNFTGLISNPILTQLIKNSQVIDFSENGFFGSIPGEVFTQCGSIRSISLANNKLTGAIPDSIGSCLTLQNVDFSSNQLSGELPKTIWASLASLRSIDLSNNFFDGEIPNEKIETLFNLRVFNLSSNNFHGELPDKIGECLLLKSVDVSNNYLVGTIPSSLQKLSLCNVLNLRSNYFAGQIPDWIGSLKSLENLDFSVNNFTGLCPASLGELESLKRLNISLNRFTGNLPESLGNCVNLSVIDFSRNLFTGNIPVWLFKLRLTAVFLSGNQFSGILEFCETAAFDSLEIFDLSLNSFSGMIPLSIGNFTSLVLLNMSHNSLIGLLPSSLGRLKAANVIDLSHNRLNGSIPIEIGGARLLEELRLESNLLTGSIPDQIQNYSVLTTLNLSQNNITGTIPVGIANLTELEYVDLSFNHLSGSLPKELTNLTNLVTFNISHNDLEGELPLGGFFNTIPLSSVFDNPSLCGSIVNQSCPGAHPKPIVLNPNPSHSDHTVSNPSRKRIILSISAIIAIGAAAFIALGVIVVTILNLHVRNSVSRSAAVALTFSNGGDDDFSHTNSPGSEYGKLVMFTGDAEFVSGTHALLTKECELGRGGFGVVYWTALRNGRSVAIKKLHVPSLVKSQQDFSRAVKKLGTIRHSNLVLLEGYYWTPSLQLLINEYVSSGSLYKHLHEGNYENTLSWRERFEIILGTAKGLAHLHQMKVIHYNIKSTNVLIDCSGEPKVGDYGLAGLLPSLDRHVLSGKIQSALGYMAPEFACQTVKITEKCDVYGFGILLLEIVTGKKPVEYMEDDVVILCDMVRRALDDGQPDECIDKKLKGEFPSEEGISVIKLGLVCASQVPSNRPDMEEVIKILEMIQCPSEGHEEIE